MTRETDEQFRGRALNANGGWGSVCTPILESSGKTLDELVEHLFGIKRYEDAEEKG